MALKITYKIRASKEVKKNSEEDITISFRLTDGRKADMTLTTPYSIPYKYWDSKTNWIKDNIVLRDLALKERLEDLNKKLHGLKTNLIKDYESYPAYTKEQAQKTIESYKASFYIMKSEIPSDIPLYVDYVISGMKDGSRRTKGEVYNANTIKAWNSFAKLLKGFCGSYKDKEKQELSWCDIDDAVFNSFLYYMEKKGYAKKTLNKYIIDLKALLSFGLTDKIHDNRTATYSGDIHPAIPVICTQFLRSGY